jgi:hypothetical protein
MFPGMNPEPPVGLRFLLSGVATLVLLAWVMIIPGTLPGLITRPGHSPNAVRILTTALLCVAIVAMLFRILLFGSTGQRVSAGLAMVFPSLLLTWILLWSLHA